MKRVKITFNKPNPLFELWLKEWKNKAKAEDSDLEHHFEKALNALKKYPLPLESGKDCIILRHFGIKLCKMLDKRLEKHKMHLKEVAKTTGICTCPSCSCTETFILSKEERVKVITEEILSYQKRLSSSLVMSSIDAHLFPLSWTCSCYAILLSLNKEEESMLKPQLLVESKKLYDESFKLIDPDLYDAKSSIYTLIAWNLLYVKEFKEERNVKVRRYSLTQHGLHVTKKLKELLNLRYDKNLIQLYLRQSHKQMLEKKQRFNKDVINLKSSTKEYKQSLQDKIILHPKIDKLNLQTNNKKTVSKTKNDKNLEKCMKKCTAEDTQNETQEEINFQPNSFEVILLVDTQETCGGKTKPQHDATLVELTQLGIVFEVRHLKVGDFAWIARCKYTKQELILPYIVERKRLDDLSSSIKDGRYQEQKFRLKQSGIENLIYVVENHDKGQRSSIPVSTLLQASINSLVQDGFNVKYTDNHKHTMSYLAILTRSLSRIYEEKTLTGCNIKDLIPTNILDSRITLMKFEEFNKAALKSKNFNVRQMFVRQLLQLKGISVDKALAIVQHYPTPSLLIDALQKCNCAEQLLAPIQYGQQKRQIGPTISKTIYLFYTQKDLN